MFIIGFTVSGEVDLKGCEMVVISNCVIGDDVEIKYTTDVAIIAGSNIGFSGGEFDDGIELEYNQGSTYQVFNNVAEDIEVNHNVINPSSPIPTFVGGNVVEELECEGNSPPPVTDDDLGPNIAEEKEGQCSGL